MKCRSVTTERGKFLVQIPGHFLCQHRAKPFEQKKVSTGLIPEQAHPHGTEWVECQQWPKWRNEKVQTRTEKQAKGSHFWVAPNCLHQLSS